MTEMYFLLILEAESSRSRHEQGCFLSEASLLSLQRAIFPRGPHRVVLLCGFVSQSLLLRTLVMLD